MSTFERNLRLNRLAVATVAALALFTAAAPLAPAMAQVYFGIGPFGVAVAPPSPYYYGPYYDPYWGPYYGPYYYPRWHHHHYR
jgi:hypothetical protein